MTQLSLPCPEGESLLSGGWRVTSADQATAKPAVLESHPDLTDDSRWLVAPRNDGSQPFSIQVVIQCTKQASAG
ncbi:hypothetical protein [Kitasatospora mediocidica]|uniref:hypothetical protein n=1 Tax=Kitasatospora mediocidica TaxID=58352 RepID=UPI0005645626|nr:hypothetical protein [Kitasatospora mediocidica]